MPQSIRYWVAAITLVAGFTAAPWAIAEEAASPSYSEKIAPIFKRYCTSCHNGDDFEGSLNLETYDALQAGGEHGPAVLAGDAGASRMIRMLRGETKPVMPPQDLDRPTDEEIALLRKWIDDGAKGPKGSSPDRKLHTPKIEPAVPVKKSVAAVAFSPDGKIVAAARFGQVDLLNAADLSAARTLADQPGKVSGVQFVAGGSQLLIAGGVPGLYGEARLLNFADGSVVRAFTGHRDAMYAARLSPDGKTLATAGYDRTIVLWNAASGEQLRTLKGHNDAIYDVAFSPDSTVIASASGDQTIKVWSVATGERLDTLSQPFKEQFCVAFSPDGQFIVGGGLDNRIRVWRWVSKQKPEINPILHARFAHEGAIVRLVFSPDGQTLVSTSDDRTIKLFETKTFLQTHTYERQPDVAAALDVAPDGKSIVVGRMDGTLGAYPIVAPQVIAAAANVAAPMPVAAPSGDMKSVAEQEPNDQPAEANAVAVPARIAGTIHAMRPGQSVDVDLYKFEAQAGQTWIIETNAARAKSPLDSKIEVLDAAGKPVLRVLLQAVRDTYITFRGVSSNDRMYRLFNWEEMQQNEFLYAAGDVCKLFLPPRGPDSGFDMFPEGGNRYGFFDTTPMAHALNETCYIVEPRAPGATLIPNGLPVFPIYFENDDDSLRQLGADSRLTFTAPASGSYLVRVSDVRSLSGETFKYELVIRPQKQDFSVAVENANPQVAVGSGKRFGLRVNRIDGFDGEVRVDITNVPPGFTVTTPIVIEAGQNVAQGAIYAAPTATAPEGDAAKASKLTATATIDGQAVTRDAGSLGEIKLAEKPKFTITLAPPGPAPTIPPASLPELVIAPGETIPAIVRIERNEFGARVTFTPQNLPHGVIVDNIGLNGVLIPEGQTEREIFITAAKWVPESSRLIHMQSAEEGNQVSWPVMLNVRKK